MALQQVVIFGVGGVTAVAVAKTALVLRLGFADAGAGVAWGIFAGLWLLTGAVALASYWLLRRFVETSRRGKILSALDDEPGKENMIEAHARDWGLTKAETMIAILVVKGFSNVEIAEMRGCALQTVKAQLSAIYKKSGLKGRYQLLAFITDEICETSRAAGRPAPVIVSDLAPKSVSPETIRARKTDAVALRLQ